MLKSKYKKYTVIFIGTVCMLFIIFVSIIGAYYGSNAFGLSKNLTVNTAPKSEKTLSEFLKGEPLDTRWYREIGHWSLDISNEVPMLNYRFITESGVSVKGNSTNIIPGNLNHGLFGSSCWFVFDGVPNKMEIELFASKYFYAYTDFYEKTTHKWLLDAPLKVFDHTQILPSEEENVYDITMRHIDFASHKFENFFYSPEQIFRENTDWPEIRAEFYFIVHLPKSMEVTNGTYE